MCNLRYASDASAESGGGKSARTLSDGVAHNLHRLRSDKLTRLSSLGIELVQRLLRGIHKVNYALFNRLHKRVCRFVSLD